MTQPIAAVFALPDPEDTLDTLADGIWPHVDGDWDHLRPAELAVFAIWSLKVEVCNGGFAQFFFNSVGEATPQVGEALTQVGALDVAALLNEAWAVVGRELRLDDWESRQARVDSLSVAERGVLSRLDDAFYAAKPELIRRTRQFAFEHRDEFRWLRS